MESLTKISGKNWNVMNCAAESESLLAVSDRIIKEAKTSVETLSS